MNKKNIVAVLSAAVLCMGLTGCGENAIPDLTDEQVKSIGEYVAVIMMKYDANHRSRLVDLPNLDKKPDVTPEPETTKAPSGMQAADDTPVKDSVETPNSYTMEEVLALPEGVTVTYKGQRTCENYPDEGEIGSFSLPASEGKKLLVLSFTLNNTSEQEQKIDLLSSGAVFRVTVNGGRSKRALSAVSLEDMPSYFGTVPANTGKEAVILVEVDEETAAAIESISLNVQNDGKSYTVMLQ